MNFLPRPYQRTMIDHVLDAPRGALWASMGTGKTSAALSALHLLDLIEPGPALVIAPLRVAQSTWPDEAAKWSQFAGMRVVPIVGALAERKAALRKRADVYTVNYENVPWLVATLAGKWPYRKVVADESTRLKGFRLRQGGVRAKALASIAHKHAVRWINLTGTPAPNGLTDLWGQTWFIDRGHRLGRSFDAFTARWFRQHPSGYGIDALPHAQCEIEGALADVCLTIDARDHFDIAAPIANTIYVEMPAKARAVYRSMEKKMFAEIEGVGVEAFNAAARTQKCLQLCIAEGVEVLTDAGWTPIERVRREHRVWDGVEWVHHGGVVSKGARATIECWGAAMTAGHEVLTRSGWRTAGEINAAGERFSRAHVRLPDSIATRREHSAQTGDGLRTLGRRVREFLSGHGANVGHRSEHHAMARCRKPAALRISNGA